MVYNIQRFSTHDGQGIRTMIFYKGCPLRCEWCSNPESQSFEPDVMFDKRICKGFGDCALAYPEAITLNSHGVCIDRTVMQDPGKLRGICASKALTVVGECKTTGELLAEIEKDIPFYRRSQGGVTLSGGEPLSQGPELTGLLKELKGKDIDISVETSLHVAWKNVARCMGLVSTFLVDLKHTDSVKFTRYTRGNIDLVLTNLKNLAGHKEHIIIRVPVIPGFNHSDDEMTAIIDLVVSLRHIREIHFIPFHQLGSEKYNMLGMTYAFQSEKQVQPEELTGYAGYAREKGLKTMIGG